MGGYLRPWHVVHGQSAQSRSVVVLNERKIRWIAAFDAMPDDLVLVLCHATAQSCHLLRVAHDSLTQVLATQAGQREL